MLFWTILTIGVVLSALAAWKYAREGDDDGFFGSIFGGLLLTGMAIGLSFLVVVTHGANDSEVREEWKLADLDPSSSEAYVTVAYPEGEPVYGYLKVVDGVHLPESSETALVKQGGDKAVLQEIDRYLVTWLWPWVLEKSGDEILRVPAGTIVDGTQLG